MAGAAAAGGVRAWSVFGEIGVRGLGGTISQLTAFNAAGRGSAAVASSIASGISSVVKVAGVAGVAIAGLGIKAVSSFASFNDAMTQSQAIMGDLTSNQMARMEEAALSMGRNTAFAARDAAEAFFFLASAGLDAEQSIAALPQVTAFAQAGMFDLATATELSTDAQSALGLTVDDASQNLENLSRVTDVLVGANTLANATVEEFSRSLTNKVGPRLRSLNKDIEEGVSALAVFADAGVKGRRAGQRLNIILRDLPQVAQENEKAFKKYNIEVFDAEGNMRNLADIVEDFEDALGGMSDQSRAAAIDQLGLNKRVADSLQILMGMSDEMRDYLRQLEDMGGITQEVANKQLRSLTGQFHQLTGAIDTFLIRVGDRLAPTVGRAADALGKMFDSIDPQRVADAVKFVFDLVLAGIENTLRAVAVVLDNPKIIGAGGLIGFFLFGAKGAILGGLIGATFSTLKGHLGEILTMVAAMRGAPGPFGVLGSAADAALSAEEAFVTPLEKAEAKLDELNQKFDRRLNELLSGGMSMEQALQVLSPLRERIRETGNEVKRLRGETDETASSSESMAQGFRDAADVVGDLRKEMEKEGTFTGIQPVEGGGDPRRFFALMGIAIPTPTFIRQLVRKQMEAVGEFIADPPTVIPFTAEFDAEKVDASAVPRHIAESVQGAGDDEEGRFKGVGRRLGRSLVSGIISGSFDLADFVKRALTTILSSALFGAGGVMGFLGIGSPAKATMPIGEGLVLGVVKGIHRTTPLLRSAMHRAFTPSISPGRAVRLAGAGRSGALNRVPQGAGFTPNHSGIFNLSFEDFPEAQTPMGRRRDKMWQEWLRNQADIAKQDGYSFERRR